MCMSICLSVCAWLCVLFQQTTPYKKMSRCHVQCIHFLSNVLNRLIESKILNTIENQKLLNLCDVLFILLSLFINICLNSFFFPLSLPIPGWNFPLTNITTIHWDQTSILIYFILIDCLKASNVLENCFFLYCLIYFFCY